MAVAFVRHHRTQTATVSSATNLSVAIDASVASVAGNTLIAWICCDNSGLGLPTVNSIDVPAGETAAWTRLAAHTSSSGTAAAAVIGELWAIVTTVSWPANTTYQVTLSAAVAAKVSLLAEFSGVTATRRGSVPTSTDVSTGGTPTTTTIGTAPATGDLVVGAASFETNTAATDDTDTTNGSWSAGLKANTASGGAAANCSGILQWKIVSAGGHQTYNPTGSSDSGAVVTALVPAAAAKAPVFLARYRRNTLLRR